MKKRNYFTHKLKLLITFTIASLSVANFALGPINTPFSDDDENILLTDILSIECYESAVNTNSLPSVCTLIGWTLPEIKDCKAIVFGVVTIGIQCPKTPTVCQINPQLCAATPDP